MASGKRVLDSGHPAAYLDRAAITPRLTKNTSYFPAFCIAAYLLTSMFYVFPPGSPQPADVLLLLAVVGAPLLVSVRIPRQPSLYTALGLFIGWITVVNVVWFCMVGDYSFVLKSTFYVYNALVFVLVVATGAYDLDRLLFCVLWACRLALPAEVLYLEAISLTGRLRATGSFNNPNQLGYWAILIMACLGLARYGRRLTLLDLGALGFGCYIIALSLSKAASIAGAVMVLSISLFCGLRRNAAVGGLVVLIIGLTYAVASGDIVDRLANSSVVANLQKRLAGIGEQKDDSLMDRGYSRIFDNPRYLVLGAGEGDYERLNPDKTQPMNELNKEFHSTIGNIFMSYGLIGISFFVYMITMIFYQAPLASKIYFVPIMMYGITHMGLRETAFWLFLGLVAVQSYFMRDEGVDRAA